MIQPFLRWVGSKRRHRDKLLSLVPDDFTGYVEPFLGSGSMFLGLLPRSGALLSDANTDLINLWQRVRDSPEDVYRHAIQLLAEHGPETYARERATFNMSRGWGGPEKAARFLYLNRTCWKGLWRVNQEGAFNVPMQHTVPRFPSIVEFLAAADALQNATIQNLDALTLLDRVMRDPLPRLLIFLDPPYADTFDGYTANGFSPREHAQLQDRCMELQRKGHYVMLCGTAEVGAQYPGWYMHTLADGLGKTLKNTGRTTKDVVLTSYAP